MSTSYPARAVIDPQAIQDNLKTLRTYAPNSLQMAVVKANAYGHGLAVVAQACLAARVDYFGVAQLPEALKLVQILAAESAPKAVNRPRIFSWIYSPHCDLKPAIIADIELSASGIWAIELAAQAAQRVGKHARIHLKVDTGLSRAGATLADFLGLCRAALTHAAWVDVVGLWSHLACADDGAPAGEQATKRALERFCQAEKIMSEAGLDPGIRHLSATSGTIWHRGAQLDLVRCGIGVYGLSPNPDRATSQDLGLHPAMRLEAQLTSVKAIKSGESVSYGGTWTAPTDRLVGLVPLGYGDGILRSASNRGAVTVAGARCPIIGRVCMDQFVVDLGPADGDLSTYPALSAQVGDWAVLFGDPQQGYLSVDDWARASGTINYEVVTAIGKHISRELS